MAVKGPGVNAKKCPFSGEKSGLCLACDAACRRMRGTLRAQGRAHSFRTVRLGFLATSRAPENTPRVPAAEHYCEANRGGLGRCPRASAVRQDTGTPLRPQLPHPRNCSKVALRLTQVLLPCAPTRGQVPPVREGSLF